jgi:hypothetical protein
MMGNVTCVLLKSFAGESGYGFRALVMRYAHSQEQHKAEAMQRLEKVNAAAEIAEFERVHTKTPTLEDSATSEPTVN